MNLRKSVGTVILGCGKPFHSAFKMLPNASLSAVQIRKVLIQKVNLSGFLDILTDRINKPTGRIGIYVLIHNRIPKKNRMSVRVLMNDALLNHLTRFVGIAIQDPHSQLRVIAHRLLSHHTKTNLMLCPVVKHPIDLRLRTIDGKRRKG